MKQSCEVTIKNMLGLHARPATTIVKLLQKCQSEVYFTYNDITINAKSIMSILILAAGENARITITAEGPDAQQVLSDLKDTFENSLGE